MAKRELEPSRMKREMEQPSCSGAALDTTMGLGVKRARFSIETLLQARSCSPESDLSPCFSPELPSNETIQTTSSTSRQSIKGDVLDGMECRLEGAELWEKFYELGTEMIITKSGRITPVLGLTIYQQLENLENLA
ncbi:hypothetical protein KIN20_006168 [Parelaphostrongylus tenuis]|uniref:T-box domain-containing protein n=1 Tax=Parelaphostrongylus tenuis TaxID=148309 RepID=A0AAD5MM64_PARTN|nr:hypothetical protein KIN20_006168 [Parelaphostrongylus tenuis]